VSRILISTCLLACFAPAHAFAQPADDVRGALQGALVCTSHPVKTVEKIAARGSDFAAGFSAVSFGSGTDQRTVIALKTPLTIAGATTSAVVVETTPSHEDFGGIVYGRFTGDIKRVTAELKLGAHRDLAGVAMGAYERQLTVEPGGAPAQVCPMTIVLTPLSNREFLLGCGWCPG
jgi:hypothetical protein